jgi:hypothetical protein
VLSRGLTGMSRVYRSVLIRELKGDE